MQTERPARNARAAIAYAVLAAAFAVLLAVPALAAAAPENDNFAAAEPLPAVLPDIQSDSLDEATKEAGEPNHAGDPGGHSVWYSWTPAEDGGVGLRGLCFSGIDPLVAVYTGTAVDALDEVASNEGLDTSECFANVPEVEFEAEAGTTYWIAVDGRGGEEGFFSLGFNQRPVNDEFASPVTVGADLPEALNASTKFSTKEPGEPNHAGDPGGHSVWFSWTPAASGPVEISTCGGNPFGDSFDTTLAVYTGATLGGLTQVAANDDGPAPLDSPGCSFASSEVRFEATAGTAYRIAVDTPSGPGGGFRLQLLGRPSNDNFASPETFGDTPFSTSVEAGNRLASKQPGEPNHAGDPGGASLWFSWTPTVTGPFSLSTCTQAGGPDTTLAVYTGATLGGLTQVVANDDAVDGSCAFADSAVEVQAVAGTTYRIAVDSREGRGQFRLQLDTGPVNDDFADAVLLQPGVPSGQLGTTRLAGKEPGEPDHAGNPGGRSVWFRWTPSTSGTVRIAACGFSEGGPDVLLGIYTGNTVGALTPVATGPASGCQVGGSAAELQAVAGTTYRIAVDTVAGAEAFVLEIAGRPLNDNFANPTSIAPEPFLPSGGETRLATKEPGEPNHAGDPGGRSVWFSWTPAKSGPVDVVACGKGGTDTLLGVYTGGAVDGLTQVAADDNSPSLLAVGECSRRSSVARLQAVAGTTYRIAVDSRGEGRFLLALERASANDGFATPNAVPTRLPAFASGNNRLASKELGEPSHAGNQGAHSVWFKWTAKASGSVQISTCSFRSGLDSVLAVYTGTELDALTQVTANDDGADGECEPSDSSADFVAVAGTTYWIAVDGADGSVGPFQLQLEGMAANDVFANPGSLGGQMKAFSVVSSRFASKQPGEPDHAGDSGGRSLWFKWTAPVTGPVSVDTCGSRFDTLLGVYTGISAGALNPVASNDDAEARCGNRSRLSFDAVANTTYRIAVDGKAGAAGTVELRLDGPPRADTLAKAERVPGVLPLFTQGSNRLAGKEPGEPNHAGNPGGHSVWVSWTPRRSSSVRLSACAGDFDPLLGVYTGATVGALAPVAAVAVDPVFCNAGTAVRFDVVANTTYRIAVDGADGDSGHFELEFEPVPSEIDPPRPPDPPRPLQSQPPQPMTATPKKPLRCKPGFKKKKVRGKVRCVKKKPAKKKKRGGRS
ncbi:MAG TPA: hypothetical protein VF081_06585 [Solirubrobacterales bacterium]